MHYNFNKETMINEAKFFPKLIKAILNNMQVNSSKLKNINLY